MGWMNSLKAKHSLPCCISTGQEDEIDGSNQETKVSSSTQEARFTILDFPTCILVEIFIRLPVKSILICHCVCKAFSALLKDSCFHNEYSKIKQPVGIIFNSVNLNWTSGKTTNSFYLFEFGDQQKLTALPVNKNMPKTKGVIRLLGSSNGLVCLSENYNKGYFNFLERNKIHVCNPVLGEYVTLPRIQDKFFNEWFSFGLNPSKNQYKVVRIVDKYYGNGDNVQLCTEVFTVGVDCKWRILKDNCNHQLRCQGPEFQGAIHWMLKRSCYWRDMETYNVLIAFDLDEEKFRSIAIPQYIIVKIRVYHKHSCSTSRLLILRNCLSILSFTHHDEELNVWAMKKYGVVESWASEYSISISLIPRNKVHNEVFMVLPIPANEWGEGEVFIFSWTIGLISYNLEEEKYAEHHVINRELYRELLEMYRDCNGVTNFVYGDTFTPSLISLKKLFSAGQASVLPVRQKKGWFLTTWK